MGRSFTIKQLEEDAAARIAKLDGTQYNQGATIKGIWRESEEPLIVDGEAKGRAHLAFNVFAESGRNTGKTRDRHDSVAKVTSDVVVMFTFSVRRGSKKTDGRESSEAAHDVMAALMASPQSDFVYQMVNYFRPATIEGSDYMLVLGNYTATYDASLRHDRIRKELRT